MLTRLTLVMVFALAPLAHAVAPSISTILPRGGQRGTELETTISGGNLGDAIDLMFHDPGITLVSITAENDKSVKATLNIAADASLGHHGVRVRTKTGVSNYLVFSVGALPEIQETEPNNNREEAPAVALDTTVNGVVLADDADYFPVALTKGQRLAVEVEAVRLGMGGGARIFDPKLRLVGPHGHELIAEDDTQIFRQDAGFVHVAEEDGNHTIVVTDASYTGAGDYYYRLHIGSFPRPFMVTPLGGAPGAELQVKWLGDPALEPQNVIVPALATGTTGMLPAVLESKYAPTPVPFRVSSLTGVLEVEPNGDSATATPGSAPGAFDGVIGEENDYDWFSFDGTAGAVYDVRVWARALGSPLDSVLHVFNPDGSVLAGDDDAAQVDSQTRVTLGADGKFFVRVFDHLLRGGERFAYRVEVTPVEPKLRTTLLENRPASLTVAQGNHTHLLVNVARSDFDGPIKVDLQDLPEGVSFVNDVLPAGQTLVPVVVSAAADAAVAGALARVTGTYEQDGTTVTGELDQEIRLVEGRNDTTFLGTQVSRLALAVSEPAPYTLELVAPAAPIVHNGSRELTIRATRAEGFTAPINLRFPWLPAGMGGGTSTIAEGANEGTIRLEVRPVTEVKTHQLFVAGQSSGWDLCTPWTPVTVEAPWVTFDIAAIETEQGKPVEVAVTLSQAKAFEGEYELSLLNLPKGLTAAPQKITKDTTEVKFTLEVAADAPEGKHGGITARTVIDQGGEPVMHTWGSAEFKVFKPLPPELAAAAPAPAPKAEGAEQPVERKTRFGT